MAPSSVNMETFLGWFGYDIKEKIHFLVFLIFAITPIHNHGLPCKYDIYKMMDAVFLFTFS